MNKVVKLAVLLAMTLIIGIATASGEVVTITFDDLPYTDTYAEIPDGYKTMNWDNMYYINDDYHPGTGYDNGIVSGEFGAFNGWGTMASASGSAFGFESAYFTDAWDHDLTVGVEGFLNEVLAYETFFQINSETPTFVDFLADGWTGLVDTVEFTSYRDGMIATPSQFLMDDMSIRTVPEPATMVLLGIGLLGAAGVGRRRSCM